MQNEKTIICHSFPAWDTPYVKSTVELMTRLAKTHRVIFIDYHYTIKDVLTSPHAPKKQILGLGSRWRKAQLNNAEVEIFNSAPILPINWIKNKRLFKWMAKLNGLLLNLQVKKLVKKHQLENSILVNAFNPIYGQAALKSWKSRKSIYYCYDEIAGTEWSGKHGKSYEQEFLKVVDEVIVTSPKLLKTKRAFNPNAHLVPNGVNLDIFKPEKTQNPSSSIGYVGAIDNRVDVELVNRIAKQFPNVSLDFYGPLKIDRKLFKSPNIKFHGAIPQYDLPNKISQMDVCLIPFVRNELTEAIYPLKANEYLAMGKAVVATNFADLSDFEAIITIADDENSFIQAIQNNLTKTNPNLQQERVTFAQQNSWSNRAELFSKRLVA